jgi:cytochrome o ubiquinol oxidase subunit II
MLRAAGKPAPHRPAPMLMGDTTPAPALEKAPHDKGSGSNVTKPADGHPPGQHKPDAPHKRDMSALIPIRTPGAPRAVQA